jgi:hypothetical protein
MSWLDRLADRMIRGAARRAPGALRERLEEEWLADFAERCGTISRLRLAAGCYWATTVIAREHAVSALAAAGAAPGKSLTAYLPQDFLFLSRRTTVIVLIVGAHVLVFLALAAGLVPHMTAPPPASTLAYTIPEVRTTEAVPESREPREITLRDFDLPYPDPVVAPLPESDSPEASAPDTATHPRPPQPQPAVVRVIGGPGNGFPDTRDFYPSAAIRLGETGATIIGVCVTALGQLSKEPQVMHSSGNLKLDGGAVRLAKAGSGHYRASTENGQAVSSCFPMRVRFELR